MQSFPYRLHTNYIETENAMVGTSNGDKDPRHHELSEGKGYAATNISAYKVTQENSGQQDQDKDEAPKFF